MEVGHEYSLALSNEYVRFIWLEWWKNERIENREKMEKWGGKRDFKFSHLCLVGGWKSGMIENRVYINLLSCPYYVTHFI